jgi:U3 small nucleolar ribonucleoprotein protein LCP5
MEDVSGSSLSALLSSITSALDSAAQSTPKGMNMPQEGLSLLNTKNELFLAYLEHLAFLLLLRIRHHSGDSTGGDSDDLVKLHKPAVEKLAELRLYLDKGVRPLENRLKYQIDQVLRASKEASLPQDGTKLSSQRHKSKIRNGMVKARRSSISSDASGSNAASKTDGSDSEISESENNLAYGPNPAAILRKMPVRNSTNQDQEEHKSGVYKPPKITPTALPMNMTEKSTRERERERNIKSAAMDDFIANELSNAPMAEPSIGSTIRAGGRATLTSKERQRNAERDRYEEENFVRLPGLSKKEIKQKAKAGRIRETFGGEEWGELNNSLNRIGHMIGGRKQNVNALERSRKRMTRGSGESLEKRRRLN